MPNMSEERLKTWLGFWKWLVSALFITGGIAWATIIINAKHKDTELVIQKNIEEAKYLSSFLDRALDDNLEKRYRFAQYFAHVSSPGGYKDGWDSYFLAIKQEVNKLEDEKQKLEDSLSDRTGRDLELAKRRISILERELASSYSVRRLPNETQPLYNTDNIHEYDLVCPDNSRKGIWGQRVKIAELPEFPPQDLYIMYGCHDEDGKKVGPFVAWYPDGQILVKGVRGGESTVYYPDGTKGMKATFQGERIIVQELWNPDGTSIR